MDRTEQEQREAEARFLARLEQARLLAQKRFEAEQEFLRKRAEWDAVQIPLIRKEAAEAEAARRARNEAAARKEAAALAFDPRLRVSLSLVRLAKAIGPSIDCEN
jgi:hypothetical protein